VESGEVESGEWSGAEGGWIRMRMLVIVEEWREMEDGRWK
jgi:hypothetical protein